MTRWAFACSETFALLMPKFLGYFVGLPLQTELIIINIFGLINSTLDWSYLRWNHQVEKIWNLSLPQQNYAPEGAVIYWIKSILSWVVIARIIIAHLYTFSYVANMYSIVTWSRPRYLLPWITISFFKNIVLEIVVLTLCFILWFEDKITTHLLIEFAIVKGVSLSVALYNWWITCYGFLEIKRTQKAELIRRFTLYQEFLHDKTARLSKSFDDNYRFSVLRPHYHHHPSMPNLEDSFYSTPMENDIDEVRFSMSLTTLLTNASWIPDDADLTPKERCMKALDITEEDILRARKRVREPLSFLSLEIIDQMSIRLERDPEAEKDLIYFLVRDCKRELADELRPEKRRLVPINEEESVANKAPIKTEKIKTTPSKAKRAEETTDDVHIDVPTAKPQKIEDEITKVDMMLAEKDDKDEGTKTELVEKEEVKIEEKEEETGLPKPEQPTVPSIHSRLPITEEKKQEKLLLTVELSASSAHTSLRVTEEKIEEKLLSNIELPKLPPAHPCLPFIEQKLSTKLDPPPLSDTHPCLPFIEQKLSTKLEPPPLSDTHPCLPFIQERQQQTCDPVQPGGKCLIKEMPNIPKIAHVMKNTIEVEKVTPEMFPCQCASPQGDRKNEEESVLNKPKIKNDCRTSETVAMANENFQSLLQAFKNAKGNEQPPPRSSAMEDKLNYHDSSGDNWNSSLLEPFLTESTTISKLMQRPDPIPSAIPLHVGISSRTLYSGLAYGKIPQFSIASGMWFHDHNSFVPRYFDPPLKSTIDSYEKIPLNNYQVYNTVHRIGLANAAGILKPNSKVTETGDRQQIVRYLDEDRRDFVHSTQSFGLINQDDSASTSGNMENVGPVNFMYLRSSDAQTEGWSRHDVIETSKSVANGRRKNVGTQTNASHLWSMSRTEAHDITETKKEVGAREGNRYREDKANNGGARIVSRNSVGNFHQANRIHSQSTSKSAWSSSQSRFSAKTSSMSATYSRTSVADEARHAMMLKKYLRDPVTEARLSALHDYVARKYEPGRWKRIDRPRPGSWGTVSLAQTAHRSGYQAPILQGKPPAYPKFMHDQESRSFASSSNDWRMMRSVANCTSSFSKRPVSVRDKRSIERQTVHSSSWSRPRKYAEPVENSESREIRALKAYNKFTLLEDKREMDAKRRDYILTSKKEKVASSVYRVQNESSNDSSLGGNSVKNVEVKGVPENRSALQEKTSSIVEGNKNASGILRNLNSKDAAVILELLDHYGGKRLREELKRMMRVNQADSKKQHTKHSKTGKGAESQEESYMSCQMLEEAQNDRTLEKGQAKQDVKEHLPSSTDGVSVHSDKSFVKQNEDRMTSTSDSSIKPTVDNSEEIVQKSPITFVRAESRSESSKLEETPDDVEAGETAVEQEVEIVPSSLSSNFPKEASSTLGNKPDATVGLESQPYHRIVVVESESTNSMESVRSDGETWVLEERLDERLLGNAFQLGSRQANMMNLFDIVRGIGLDFHPPRVVTNAEMQGRSVNINDLRKSTQAHIVDDTTASLLHNAFYFKSEIIVRTIQDASSFGSDSQTDTEDTYSGMSDIFAVHRLRARPDDFVCYANASDVTELGYQHLGNQHSSADDEEESTFNLCLILDQDDLSEATDQSSAALSAETIHRQIEYQNSLENFSAYRLDIQFVESLQEQSSGNLEISELNESADTEREAEEIELRSYDESNGGVEVLRQKIMREFFLANEEYISNLNFPIKCNMFDIIPALEDHCKKNWQIEPLVKLPKGCVVTANAILPKDEPCKEGDKIEATGINASQFNKFPSTSGSPTIFTPALSQYKFFDNSASSDDLFPPDGDIPQSTSSTQIEIGANMNILTNMKTRIEDEEETMSLERRESSDSKEREIEPEPSKTLDPRPSKKQFPFAMDEGELSPLNIIFAFCQLIMLLYIQFFFTALFPNEKASKSTITSGPYELHSVYTSTTRLLDPPSMNNRIYRRSSSRQMMKLTSNKSIPSINENVDIWPANENIIKIIEPLSTTETFPELTKKEIASIISDILNDVIKCMDYPLKSSPSNSQTRSAERHSSVFFEPQKSFYLLDADADTLSGQIITAGNQLPKQKSEKDSDAGSVERLRDESSSSTAAANVVLNMSSEYQIQKQPLDVTSSGFQYTDSFNSTFTRDNESSQSEVTLGERSPMEDFSREASVSSESQLVSEETEEQAEERIEEKIEEKTEEKNKEQTES